MRAVLHLKRSECDSAGGEMQVPCISRLLRPTPSSPIDAGETQTLVCTRRQVRLEEHPKEKDAITGSSLRLVCESKVVFVW